jgi:hypothetical protein
MNGGEATYHQLKRDCGHACRLTLSLGQRFNDDAKRSSGKSLRFLVEYLQGYLNAEIKAKAAIRSIKVIFRHTESSKQCDLLHEMLERVVVNRASEIIRVELKPPFAYIQDLMQRIWGGSEKTKTSISAGECSVYVASSLL